MLDRSPVVVLCLCENVQSSLDIGKIRPERFDDGQDLIGMDAPHPQEAKLPHWALRASPRMISLSLSSVVTLWGDDAVSQGRCRNFGFGAGNQRMIELSRAGHRPPGMAPWWPETKSMSPKSRLSTPGGSVSRPGAAHRESRSEHERESVGRRRGRLDFP